METKVCSVCQKDLPVEDFHFESKKTGKRKSKCKFCQAEYAKQYKERNPDGLREKWRLASNKYATYDRRRNKTLRQYGLDESDYNKMFDAQEGRCKICSREFTLVVDHCHTSGQIRGLLCNMCNTALGLLQDDIEVLENAVQYLKMAVAGRVTETLS